MSRDHVIQHDDPHTAHVQVHPGLSGVGYGSTVVAALVGCYYNVIIAWCLYYLGSSIQVGLSRDVFGLPAFSEGAPYMALHFKIPRGNFPHFSDNNA